MSTNIRPNVSKKNSYWIPKHRYYELKHFCLQYNEWKEALKDNEGLPAYLIGYGRKDAAYKDPTANAAIARERITNYISAIEETAKEADPEIWRWLLRGVTEELSWKYLKMRCDLCCERDMYYDRYRKFFYILSKKRM